MLIAKLCCFQLPVRMASKTLKLSATIRDLKHLKEKRQ